MLYLVLLLGLSGVASANRWLMSDQPGVHHGALSPFENAVVQNRCGRSPPKKSGSFYIVNGKNMTQQEMAKEAPWVVSIHYISENKSDREEYKIMFTFRYTCTGVLISKRHVLTAAHCQEYQSARMCKTGTYRHDVVFGKREVARYRIRTGAICGNKNCDREGKTYHVKRIIYPASWTLGHTAYGTECALYKNDAEDIAIHELTEDVEGAQFPCLAQETRMNEQMSNYGYGYSHESMPERNFLKKHIIHYVDCKPWTKHPWYMAIANGTECVHYIQPNASLACHGDSGGPVITEHDGLVYTAGVLTGGGQCDKARKEADRENGYFTTIGDMMTSVPHYLNWICKWSGVCPPQADATKDQRPTNIWHRNDATPKRKYRGT